MIGIPLFLKANTHTFTKKQTNLRLKVNVFCKHLENRVRSELRIKNSRMVILRGYYVDTLSVLISLY